MPKAKKSQYYAVRKGRQTGIYHSWPACQAQTDRFPGAQFKGFATLEEAQNWLGDATRYGRGSRPPSEPGEPVSSNPPPVEGVPDLAKNLAVKPVNRATPDEPLSHEIGWTIIYTDGACKGNGKAGSIAGSGVWFGDNHPKNLSERTPGDQTNNRAELIAIIRALESCKPEDKVIIKTDSAYSQDCIVKWLPRWHLNGYKTSAGEPIKNKEIILYLSELLSVKPARTFRFVKVKAHVGIYGNECADYLANLGCYKAWREEAHDEWDLDKVVKPEIVPDSSQKAIMAGEVEHSMTFSDADMLSTEDLEAEINS